VELGKKMSVRTHQAIPCRRPASDEKATAGWCTVQLPLHQRSGKKANTLGILLKIRLQLSHIQRDKAQRSCSNGIGLLEREHLPLWKL